MTRKEAISLLADTDTNARTSEQLQEAVRLGIESMTFLDSFTHWLNEGFVVADELWRMSYNDQWRECRRDTLQDVLTYFLDNQPGGDA